MIIKHDLSQQEHSEQLFKSDLFDADSESENEQEKRKKKLKRVRATIVSDDDEDDDDDEGDKKGRCDVWLSWQT